MFLFQLVRFTSLVAGVEVAGPDLSLVEVRTEALVCQLALSVADSLAAPAATGAGTEDSPGAPDLGLLGGYLGPCWPLLHWAGGGTVAPLPGQVAA